jgi:hypothetical protein
MTHTEKVHVIFGLLAAVTGALAWWSVYRPTSPARLIWPVLAFLIGFFLFIPVEAQTRTYTEVGWWQTLLSAVPDNATYWVQNWFRYLKQWHVVQHKIGGLLIMVAAWIEYQRARDVRTRHGALLFPLLLLGIAAAFGIHGGSSAHLPSRTEQIQHWLMGGGFAAAAIALALVRVGWLAGRAWQSLWAVFVLAMGLELTSFYRLSPADFVEKEHHHEGVGSGLRRNGATGY